MPLGMFQTVVSVYAVEVTPMRLRVYLTSYNNMCWVSNNDSQHLNLPNLTTIYIIGQTISSGVLRGFLNMAAPGPIEYPLQPSQQSSSLIILITH